MSKPTTVLDVLIAARARIEREEDWGQGIDTLNPIRAICAEQAIGRECGSNIKLFCITVEALCVAAKCPYIPTWNDTHSHAEVIAGFDAAIVRARRDAQVTALLSAASVPAERGELVSVS